MHEWGGWDSLLKAASGALLIAAPLLEQHALEVLLALVGVLVIWNASRLVQSNKELEAKVDHVMTVEIPAIKRDLAYLSGQHDSHDPHNIIRRL